MLRWFRLIIAWVHVRRAKVCEMCGEPIGEDDACILLEEGWRTYHVDCYTDGGRVPIYFRDEKEAARAWRDADDGNEGA